MKAFAQRLVGHPFTHNPFQGAVLVAGAYSIVSVHILEVPWTINGNNSAAMSDVEIGRGKLIDFSGMHDLINTTALFLANAHAAHKVGEAFVSRLMAVTETLARDTRHAGAR